MPIIFLFSAVVSGMALLIVLYVVAMGVQRKPLNHHALRSLAGWLAGFLAVNVTIEALEVATMMYMQERHGTPSVRSSPSDWLRHLVINSSWGRPYPGPMADHALPSCPKGVDLPGSAAAVLTLVGVFAMRWNVVIGGQILSKSLRGFSATRRRSAARRRPRGRTPHGPAL
jgi:predicted membrane protein